MKNLLLHMNDDAGLGPRLETALTLARAFDAKLTCLHTATDPDVALDIYAGGMFTAPIASFREEAESNWRAFRERMEHKLESEDVVWEWHRTGEAPARALAHAAILTDLTIMSIHEARDGEQTARGFLADVITSISGPVLAVPQSHTGFTVGGNILVAWKGTEESGRAMRAAIPLLQRANDIRILAIGDVGGSSTSARDAAAYLGDYGIKADVLERGDDDSAETIIMSAAREFDAGLVVMGAYGRSRLAETLLGGATQGMLAQLKVPLLLNH